MIDDIVYVESYNPSMTVEGKGKIGMTKAEAFQVMDQIDDAYGIDEFITVYFNLGRKKDLRFCNDSDEAKQVLDEINDSAKIAIEVDEKLVQRVTDLEQAWRELDGE